MSLSHSRLSRIVREREEYWQLRRRVYVKSPDPPTWLEELAAKLERAGWPSRAVHTDLLVTRAPIALVRQMERMPLGEPIKVGRNWHYCLSPESARS